MSNDPIKIPQECLEENWDSLDEKEQRTLSYLSKNFTDLATRSLVLPTHWVKSNSADFKDSILESLSERLDLDFEVIKDEWDRPTVTLDNNGLAFDQVYAKKARETFMETYGEPRKWITAEESLALIKERSGTNASERYGLEDDYQSTNQDISDALSSIIENGGLDLDKLCLESKQEFVKELGGLNAQIKDDTFGRRLQDLLADHGVVANVTSYQGEWVVTFYTNDSGLTTREIEESLFGNVTECEEDLEKSCGIHMLNLLSKSLPPEEREASAEPKNVEDDKPFDAWEAHKKFMGRM